MSDSPAHALDRLELPDGIHALQWGTDGPPVVLVHGRDGSAASWIPASSAAAFMEHHPGRTHIDLPEVGHVPPLEAPDRTADAIVA